MTDVVDAKTRSRMMAGIRSRDTRPELLVRKALHARGFRFSLRNSRLPGRPDLALTRYRIAIHVHGCFWHGHECRLFRWPRANRRFWRAKIEGNQQRDHRVAAETRAAGWHIITIWECRLRGASPEKLERLFDRIGRWIVARTSRAAGLEIG